MVDHENLDHENQDQDDIVEEIQLDNNNNQNQNNNNNNNNTENYNTPHVEEENQDGEVNVEKGVREFKKMAAHLEMESERLRLEDGDVEGRPAETEEDFKLRNYFEDSQRQLASNGAKAKKMGVSIRDLTVVGRGADASIIPDMLTPLKWFFNLFNPYSWYEKMVQHLIILHNINAFVKDGEMLLVLGRPGSGCSTLLRLVSNQRESYVAIKGDVSYGGLPSKKWSKYRGEAIYTPEEDCHHPTLTVRETLDFTLKCKTPGQRLPDETKRTFRDKIFNLLLNMFGIVHQADTMVGNEWVRGLSGGERKRMTITEAMVSAAPITCWDCSTRGLDAASALDYAKSLRIMSDTLDKTTIASFYQASDSIYHQFDNVLVLEKGRCIYFGPIGEAKQYFLDMGFECEPRKSVADFLTGVTNPQERKISENYSGVPPPETSADFEARWLQSPQYQRSSQQHKEFEEQLEREQPHVAFAEQVIAEKSRTTSNSKPYVTSFVTQVMALTVRHFQLIGNDKFGICSRYISLIIQSFIYGSIFFQVKGDLNGLFTRGGAIFASLLLNAFLSQGELPMTFFGRRILQKHRSYALYRPSAFHIAQVISDIPILVVQVFLYSIIAYFMFGLQYSADQFFIFCFTLIGTALALTNLFRLFGNFCSSLYIAQNIMSVYLIFMLTFGGYIIPYPKIQEVPWFGWFFWINPVAYAFKALMANEFRDTTFDCTSSAIPAGPGYTDPAYRVCPIPGGSPGQMSITGEAYLDYALGFKIDDRALNVCVVYLWWLLFTAMNMWAMEKFDWTSGGYTHKVYKPGKAPKINDAEDELKQIRMVQEATAKIKDTLKMPGGEFSWQNIKYTVPLPDKTQKLLLDDVEGWIKPGQMTALMGSSGAGKTTLLDVLAKRKTLGTVQGTSLLNGKPLDIDFERITGYVEQMDVHNPHLTVREALRFSAKMRQEPSVSLEEKFSYVEHVLEMMEMKHLGDALIGSLESGVGISVEERKRLTIGLELVAKPHILFLDEPTSGLDSQSSYNIIKFIRKLADAGMPLVCTIHQPSSVLFEYFDRLLLLAKGGKTAYFGDIGENSKTLTSYFERHGVRACIPSENPAEYMLEAIGAGVHGKTDIDWPAAWKSSPECADITKQLNEMRDSSANIVENKEPAREFATSTMYQLWEVYKRMNIIWWRDPYYSFGRFFQSVLTGLVLGFSFYNIQSSSSDMLQRVFFIFQAIFLAIMLIFIALPQFFLQREYFRRDYSSKYYSWGPFALSIVVVELPYIIITNTIFFFCAYWTVGLQFDADSGFYFWLMGNVFLFFSVSFGQVIAAICANMFFAMIIVPLLIVFLFLFSGVMVIPKDIPTFWRYFVYPLNPARYYLEGIVTNILKDVKVKCTDTDLLKFNAPPGQTCGEYAKAFTDLAPGYLDNPNDTANCGYCTFDEGAEYYDTLEWSADNRWRNFGIIVCFWVFNTLLVIAFVYLTRRANR
ncbi:hypothetical protein DFA_03470 [Cavenderia fasciculata]|uniref:ABC transporter domain-containing protein n=1 Tax=Cavenderia fasciculata TaxID=261658 RepID=F4PHN8_CACFS|nr:uncharacterized protein DFA_03470 [Cavenderia fasciculata]EGG25222.1 hypothetical protein DFA_03470 [Cavenderia fasciculata]|eukprot:XP_004363073.1 hypothetical protein DFA_03470 [Cavenderia fasciculata]